MSSSNITIKTEEGVIFQVKKPVAIKMHKVRKFIENNHQNTTLPLPNVNCAMLSMILHYIITHMELEQRNPRNENEEKAFDRSFTEGLDIEKIKELIIAAHDVEANELVDVLARAAAERLEGQSAEFINKFLGVDNLSPEEEAELEEEMLRALQRL